MFIVFEGITSSGKTTQAKLLAEHLSKEGKTAVFNHEPTKKFTFGRIARGMVDHKPIDLKDLEEAEASGQIPDIVSKIKRGKSLSDIEKQMLYMVDRKDDLEKLIKPEIGKGNIVIQDRYELSTLAYGMACGLAFEELHGAQSRILGDSYRRADVTFYFDIEPETAAERLKESGKIIDIFENLPMLIKTREAYQSLISMGLWGPVAIIDARVSIDRVAAMLASHQAFAAPKISML